MDYTPEDVQLTEQPTAVVRDVVDVTGIAAFLGRAYGEILEALSRQGCRPAGMPFARYEPTPEGMRVEAGFPTDGTFRPEGTVTASSLPGGPAVTVMHRGAYDLVPAAYQAAEAWLTEHGLRPSAPPWESYLDDPEVPRPRTVVTVPHQPA